VPCSIHQQERMTVPVQVSGRSEMVHWQEFLIAR
jgi:hypothetical protein